jgi:hypothetical protein
MRRGAAALVAITGLRRTRASCRAAAVLMSLSLVVGAVLPVV